MLHRRQRPDGVAAAIEKIQHRAPVFAIKSMADHVPSTHGFSALRPDVIGRVEIQTLIAKSLGMRGAAFVGEASWVQNPVFDAGLTVQVARLVGL